MEDGVHAPVVADINANPAGKKERKSRRLFGRRGADYQGASVAS